MTGAIAWNGRPVGCVLFDLDGTLIETAGDIALALNRALAEHGIESLPVDVVRTLIGRGAPRLVSRAVAMRGLEPSAELCDAIFEQFLDHYARLHDEGESSAVAFPGVVAALGALTARGVPLAVVTNKQHRLAVQALHHAGIEKAFGVIVGGDTCAKRKPDPQPLLHACQALGVPADRALMIGDSVIDVTAARAASIPVLCVPYGYNEGNDPRALPCDGFIDTIGLLPGLLLGTRPGPM